MLKVTDLKDALDDGDVAGNLTPGDPRAPIPGLGFTPATPMTDEEVHRALVDFVLPALSFAHSLGLLNDEEARKPDKANNPYVRMMADGSYRALMTILGKGGGSADPGERSLILANQAAANLFGEGLVRYNSSGEAISFLKAKKGSKTSVESRDGPDIGPADPGE